MADNTPHPMEPSASMSNHPMHIQSEDHEQLLNVIDDIRSQRISDVDNLPQIIVCGDQSSGKSSVLEAISGLKFPTKDALCTRFATELVLRRRADVSLEVKIDPDEKRPQNEQDQLKAWEGQGDIYHHLDAIFEQATEVMGINRSSKNFSADVLRIILSGPDQPHLTLVDLPGLFHSGSRSQSDEDAEAVRSLVTEHMQRSRSIILAVVSAKNDLNNQIVTKYAKDYDPDGQRTLGIITKPDTLPPDSESERKFVDLAENKDVQFRLGWHVLKNRSYEERGCTLQERDQHEREFFGRGVWATLPPSQVGVASLKSRLSTVLQAQILNELTSLIDDIDAAIQTCQSRLYRLGSSRASIQEQRVYLHHVSEAFTTIIQEAVRGGYRPEDYFGDPSTDEGFTKRIRAKAVDLTEQFRDKINTKGHKYQIVDKAPVKPSKTAPFQVTHEQRLEQVQEMIKRNRGTELAAVSREENITALFREQSSPWPAIARKTASSVFDHVRQAILCALEFTCDESTRPKILSQIVNPALTTIYADFSTAVDKVLHQHVHGFPITLNHYLTDNLQKARTDHSQAVMAIRLEDFFGVSLSLINSRSVSHTFDVKALLNHLTNTEDHDMGRVQGTEALHFMNAYYKVAKKNFIDDFTIYAVEQDLLSKLHTVFSPATVISLDEPTIQEIAGETHECVVEREQLKHKLATLQHVLVILERLQRNHSGRTYPPPASPNRSDLSEDQDEADTNEEVVMIAAWRMEEELVPDGLTEDDEIDVIDNDLVQEQVEPSPHLSSLAFDIHHPELTPSARSALTQAYPRGPPHLTRAIQSLVSIKQHFRQLSPPKRQLYMRGFANKARVREGLDDWTTARLNCIVHCMASGEW